MKKSSIARFSSAALVALGLFAVSSGTMATELARSSVVKIKELPAGIKSGMSQAEVEQLLGKPENKPRWLSGLTTWTYRTDVWNQRFDIDFDAAGKVRSSGLYTTANPGNT